MGHKGHGSTDVAPALVPAPATTASTTTAPAGAALAARPLVQGERYHASTRLVVSPGSGVFHPAAGVGAGLAVRAGQVVGHIGSGSDLTPVISQFDGETRDVLAWPGERLTSHQPVMWLLVEAPPS